MNDLSTEEAGPLACEMAAAYEKMVGYLKHGYKMSDEDAIAEADKCDEDKLKRIAQCEPSELSWLDLRALTARCPEAAAGRWQQIKQMARKELRSGHRAAKAMEWEGRRPDPYLVDVLLHRARLYQDTARPDKGIADYERILKLNPDPETREEVKNLISVAHRAAASAGSR